MKKNILKVITFLPALALTGCDLFKCDHFDSQHDGVCDLCGKSVEVVHFDNNHDGKCDYCGVSTTFSHVDEDNDSKCDICHRILNCDHVDLDNDNECDKCHANLKEMDFSIYGWDTTTAELIYSKLGIVIPYVPSNGYDYEYGVDIFGDNYVNIYLYYSNEETATYALNNYYNICSDKEYTMNLDNLWIDPETYYEGVGYADLVIEGNKAVEIIFLNSMKNGKHSLGLFATNYLYIPKDEYPSLAIEKSLGERRALEIPNVSVEGATYSYYSGFTTAIDENEEEYTDSLYLEVHVYNVDQSIERTFFNGLHSNKNIEIYVENSEFEDESGSSLDGLPLFMYPGEIYGNEYWAYRYNKTGLEYAVQFGYQYGSMYSDPYFYFVIYYNIV